MKKIHGWASLFAALFFLVGCHASQKTVAPKTTEIGPTENALLWKITGLGLKKPSYLFGTIHLIPANKFEVKPPVRAALEKTKRLTFEIDLKTMFNISSQFSLMSKAMMRGGKTLKTLLSADDYALVKSKMEEKGLPMAMFERMKPMFLTMMVGQGDEADDLKSGATTSVEMELFSLSKKQKMETAGLETADFQMSVFDSIPYEAQAKMLIDGLRSTEKGDSEFDKMVELYLKQDIEKMHDMSATEADFSKYEDLLLNQRNAKWIPLIGEMAREKPTFFAVGAGHLGGEKGVVFLLRKAGWPF